MFTTMLMELAMKMMAGVFAIYICIEVLQIARKIMHKGFIKLDKYLNEKFDSLDEKKKEP